MKETTMPAPILLASEVTPEPGALQATIETWSAIASPAQALQRALYAAHDGSSALELLALPDAERVANLRGHFQASWERLGLHLASDFRRQLLEFVEAPKSCSQPLPTTAWLQLRHVEVPPLAHDDYLAWREATIFDVVRQAPEVKEFIAYHSLLSTEPGVMFLSGFDGDLEAYSRHFSSPRYQQIVREAGTQFITGGDKGLFTKIYRRVGA
jgi:hypothetical protein